MDGPEIRRNVFGLRMFFKIKPHMKWKMHHKKMGKRTKIRGFVWILNPGGLKFLRDGETWVLPWTPEQVGPNKICGLFKVHIFWEGHKILRNLHLTFDRMWYSQKQGGDFAKFCGLLRIYELYQKLFWPFTVWINCSSDLKKFANSRPSASNFKSFSRSLKQCFLTVGQNNFWNRIPFFEVKMIFQKQWNEFMVKVDKVKFW